MKRTAYNTALDLLARREHSAAQLRHKLRLKGFEDEAVEAALERLRQDGLQADARFAEAYAHGRMRRGYGPLRIRHELREHGVADGLIEAALREVDCDWFELALEQQRKRFTEPPRDMRSRARQQAFLQRRGFSGEQIRYALRACAEQDRF